MLERMKHADGLGAIYPPMQYAIMALDVLGYPENSPVRMEAVRQFENLMVDDGKTLFFQPCFSPVWDTAILSYALGEAGYRGSRGADQSRGLAAGARDPAQGRLVGQAAVDRAFRLGVRIPERLVSRYRRHRHGDAGVSAHEGVAMRRPSRLRGSARWTGCSPCSRRMADGRRSMWITTGRF